MYEDIQQHVIEVYILQSIVLLLHLCTQRRSRFETYSYDKAFLFLFPHSFVPSAPPLQV